MDRLQAMSMFVDVVECGNLSAVSRKHDIPLATVSRRIADLEEHLKTRLLLRSSRKVTLTDSGESYLAACRQVLDLVNDAERAVAGEYSTPKGDLAITATVGLGHTHLAPVVNEFLEAYPEINIRLILFDKAAHLIDDQIDLAVRIGTLPDSSMMASRIGNVRRVMCGSPKYFAKYGRPRDPSELPAFPCVAHKLSASPVSWDFRFPGSNSDEPVTVYPRLGATTSQTAVEAVLAGIGLSRLYEHQISEKVASGELETVLDEFEPPPLPVNLLHVGQGRMAFKLRTFLDFATPRLRQALAATKLPIRPQADDGDGTD